MDLRKIRELLREAAKFRTKPARTSQTLDEIIAVRAQFLTAYQNKAYADRYRDLVAKVGVAEKQAAPRSVIQIQIGAVPAATSHR